MKFSDPVPPDLSSSEKRELLGRGLKIVLIIEPQISKKDIHQIRGSLVAELLKYYSAVDMSFYKWDDSRSALKFVTEQAKFRLFEHDVPQFYRELLRDFLRYAFRDLRGRTYALVDYQIEFITEMKRSQQEGGFIQLPSAGDIRALIPPINQLVSDLVTEKKIPENQPAIPDSQNSVNPAEKQEQKHPVKWIEKHLKDSGEMQYRQKALENHQNNRTEECLQICVEGLSIYPDSPFLLYLLGKTLGNSGKPSDALFLLDRLLKLHPECGPAYFERGKLKRILNDVDGSQKDYKKAQELQS